MNKIHKTRSKNWWLSLSRKHHWMWFAEAVPQTSDHCANVNGSNQDMCFFFFFKLFIFYFLTGIFKCFYHFIMWSGGELRAAFVQNWADSFVGWLSWLNFYLIEVHFYLFFQKQQQKPCGYWGLQDRGSKKKERMEGRQTTGCTWRPLLKCTSGTVGMWAGLPSAQRRLRL